MEQGAKYGGGIKGRSYDGSIDQLSSNVVNSVRISDLLIAIFFVINIQPIISHYYSTLLLTRSGSKSLIGRRKEVAA